MSFKLDWGGGNNGIEGAKVGFELAPEFGTGSVRLDLSATRYLTLSAAQSRLDQHVTREAAVEFARSTSRPDNAVYVFELKGVYSFPYELTYP